MAYYDFSKYLFFGQIVQQTKHVMQLAVPNNRVLDYVSVEAVLINYLQLRSHQRESVFGLSTP